MKQKRSKTNWHRADVVAELRKKNTSLSELGRMNGYSSNTLRNALDKPYPNAEIIIANALGLKPQDIWPERYS